MQDRYKAIPKILKDLNIWLCYDDRDKDYFINLSDEEIKQERKAPRDLKGKKCSYKKRTYTFKECLDSIERGFNSGIGLSMQNKGLICIDYDNCISDYKVNDKLGLKIPIINDADRDRILRDINLLDSYTEISPSGKGIHIIIMANDNIKININRDDIEIYTNHFIRLSGNLFNEMMYKDIEDKTSELNDLLDYYKIVLSDDAIGKKSILKLKDNHYKTLLGKNFKYINTYTNTEIKKTMFNSKKGKLLEKLYNNTISDEEFYKLKSDKALKDIDKIDTSDSGKAITLIFNLFDFCYGDIDAVYKIFKDSKLCKDKYLKKVYSNHSEDIITNQFIPYVIINYINYRK